MAGTGAPANNRPLSPHMQVWRWTPTMAASIAHRATGVALYAGAMLLALWFATLAMGPSAYAPIRALLASPLGLVALFGFAWSLIFHELNGIRHLYWDTGRGMQPKAALASSWAVFGLSLVAAAALFAPALLGGQ